MKHVNNSRTEKIFKNSSIAIIGHAIEIVLKFIVQTVFIYTLSVDYLGVNGLFTNILSVLSLAELGLGTSIVISIYKPLAQKDNAKTHMYIDAFRTIYTIVGAFIFIAGICIMPFLDFLIKDSPDVGNLKLIFVLYLVDSSASYFFAHYSSILNADQKGYINSLNKITFSLIRSATQIAVLVLWENFYLYLIVKISIHFISGYSLSLKAKKLYPFLNEKLRERLSKSEVSNLFRNSMALFMHRIGYTVLNSTDNILLSTFVGAVTVGIYSNYLMLITAISGMMALVVSSFQAAVGNICVTESLEKQQDIFYKINFLFIWVYGVFLVCFNTLGSDFILLWIGKDYIMDNMVLKIIYLNFFVQGVRQVVVIFTTANGLFYRMRFKPIIEVLINIVVSVVLVKYLGTIGVFIGTLISFITTSFWYEPYTLYSKYFGKGISKYYRQYFTLGFGVVLCLILTEWVCSYINGMIIGSFIFKLILSLIIPNVILYIAFNKCKEFEYFRDIIKQIIGSIIAKIKTY